MRRSVKWLLTPFTAPFRRENPLPRAEAGGWLEAWKRLRRHERRSERASAGIGPAPYLPPLVFGGLTLTASLLAVVLVFQSSRDLERERRIRVDGARSLDLAARLLASLVDVETGRQAYLLTGRREFFESLSRSGLGIPELRRQMLEVAGGHPEFRARLERLGRTSDQLQALAAEAVRTRREPDGRRAAAWVTAGRGRDLLGDAVSGDFAIQEGWVRAMFQSLRHIDRSNSTILLILLAGTVAGLLAFGVAARGIRRYIHHIHSLLTQVRESEHHSQVLAGRIEEAAERERARMSRLIHDDVGQALAAVELELVTAKLKGSASGPGQDRWGRLHAVIANARKAVRNTSVGLRPLVLEQLGLRHAIEWQLRTIRQQPGLAISLSYEVDQTLDGALETTLFRIVQEALSNSVCHAGARSVGVELRLVEGGLECVVRDDGRGFQVEAVAADYSSVGLLGMRERAQLAGATLDLFSAPGEGTEVRVFVPRARLQKDGGI